MSDSPTPIWGWRGATSGITQRTKRSFETGERSDIQFYVGREYGPAELFNAHKYVLSISSDVFDTMFYGDFPGVVENPIKLPDILPQAFRVMLKYVYTDVVEDLNMETVLSTAYCAQKYGLPMLLDICAEYAMKNVDKATCLAVLEGAKDLDMDKLVSRCLAVVDLHGSQLLKSNDFPQLKHETLQLILKRDTLRIDETEVYTAAERWALDACRNGHIEPTGANCSRMLGGARFLIRFPLMDDEQLADGPVATGMLLPEEAREISQIKYGTKKWATPFSSIPRQRITFCGLEWLAVDQSGKQCIAADNVFVDEHGHLHLRLCQHNGVWQGAGVCSVDALGFGLYELQIGTPLDLLKPGCVFGMVSQDDVGSGVGVHLNARGNKSEGQARYIVQWPDSSAPTAIGKNSYDHDFQHSRNVQGATHCYDWEAGNVWFSSHYGHQSSSRDAVRAGEDISSCITDATLAAIPQKAMHVVFALTNPGGNGPSNGNAVEIVVHSFRFLPPE